MALATRLRSTSHWSDPRVKPPFGGVEIDWGHPLAPDGACVLLNEGVGRPIDLIDRASLTQVSGSVGPGWTTTYRGATFIDDAWNGHGETDSLDPWNRIPLQSPYSMVLNVARFGGQGDFYAFLMGTLGSGLYGFIRSTSAGAWLFFSGGWVAQGGTVVLEQFTTLMGVASASDQPSLYQDGVLVAPSGGAGDSRLSATTPKKYFLCGSESGPTSNSRTWLEQASVYRRVLSGDDARWLTAEPYVFLRPIVRRRYFIFTQAAVEPEVGQVQEHIGRAIGRGFFVGR